MYASVNWFSIGSGHGLLLVRRQAITWTNVESLSIKLLGTNFSEILIKVQNISLTKMHLKTLSAKWPPFGGWVNTILSLPFQLVPLTVSTKDSSQNSGPRSRNQQKCTVRSNSTVPPSASSKQKSASHRQNNQQTRPPQFRCHKPVLPAATSNQEPPSHQQSNQQIRTPILRWWLVICQMRFKIRFTNMLLHSLSPLPHNAY